MRIEDEVRAMVRRSTAQAGRQAAAAAPSARERPAGSPAAPPTPPSATAGVDRSSKHGPSRRRVIAGLVAAASVAVAGVVGVTVGSSDGPGRPGSDGQASALDWAADDAGRLTWEQVLTHLPEADNVGIVDYARARRAAGLGDDATDAEIAAAYRSLAERGALREWQAEGIVYNHGVGRTRKLYGVGGTDVDRVVELGWYDQADPTLLVLGRFDVDAVDRAARRPDNPLSRRLDHHRAVPYHVWGEDHEFPTANSRLAVDPRFLVATSFTPEVVTTVDALLDGNPAAEALRPVADVAEELRLVHLGLVMDPRAAAGPDAGADARSGRDGGGEPLEYPVVEGGGAGIDEDGVFEVLMLLYADDDQARRNRGRLDTRLERLAPEVPVEVTERGPVLVLRTPADGDHVGALARMLHH